MSPMPCCRRCEFWDPGALWKIATARWGDCLHIDGPQPQTPGDSICDHFSEDPNVYDCEPPKRAAKRAAPA